MAYPTDVLNGKIDDVYVSAGNAQSDLAGVVAGADVLASQFVDVKNTMQYLQSLMNELKSNYWYVPVGLIAPFGGALSSTPPNGWLFCDGKAYNASTTPVYQNLFDVIANAYGGSSNSDFRVPDLRGRAPIGQTVDAVVGAPSLDAGITARSLGVKYGAESLPTHTHGVSAWSTTDGAGGHSHGGLTGGSPVTGNFTAGQDPNDIGSSSNGVIAIGNYQNTSYNKQVSNANHQHSISVDGGHNHTIPGTTTVSGTDGKGGTASVSGLTHGVVQPSLAMSFIIKY